jgi:hypothetical protein
MSASTESRDMQITVTFADEAYDTLRGLAQSTGRSVDDLLSEALALEQKLVDVRQAGGRVIVERSTSGPRVVTFAQPDVTGDVIAQALALSRQCAARDTLLAAAREVARALRRNPDGHVYLVSRGDGSVKRRLGALLDAAEALDEANGEVRDGCDGDR